MKSSITCSISFSFIWPWPIAMRACGTIFWIECGDRLDRFDAVVNEKDLPVARQLQLDRRADDALGKLHDLGVDRQAIARRRFDHRHVPHPEQRHVQRSRDRRCGERQHIDLFLQLLQLLFVRDAEPLFFIDDDQAESSEASRHSKACDACRSRHRRRLSRPLRRPLSVPS